MGNKEILIRAKGMGTWADLATRLETMIGTKNDTNNYSKRGRVTRWLYVGIIPKKYIKAVAELAGVPPADIVEFNIEKVRESRLEKL